MIEGRLKKETIVPLMYKVASVMSSLLITFRVTHTCLELLTLLCKAGMYVCMCPLCYTRIK